MILMSNSKIDRELKKFLLPREEYPYIIPDTWELVRIESLVGKVQQRKPTEPFTYIDIASIDNKSKSIIAPKLLNPDEAPSRARRIVREGSIVYSTVRPYLENMAIVPKLKNPIASTGFCVLNTVQNFSNKFLFYYLQTDYFKKQMIKKQTGASYPAVKDKDILHEVIPVPPLLEQKRIVQKLESSFKVIDKIEKDLAKAKDLLKKRHEALLQKAFRGELSKSEIGSNNTLNDLNEEIDKPYNIPSHWKCVQVKEVSEKIQYGYTASADNNITEVKFLRITDIKADGVNWDEVPGCIIDEKNINKYKLSNNDILIARTGGTVGKSFIVKNPPLSTFASYLIRIKLKEHVLAEYFRYFLDTKYYWDYISLGKRGAAQPNVNATQLGNMLFPLPPMLEQKRIVEILDKESKKQKEILEIIEQAEEKLKKMRQSLLQKAFRGELVEQRPEEGTGLDLLKEIIEEKLNKEK
ncbi:MAG: hypothetical protein CW346_01295 [Bacillaceae bacterium]|nr:hypothetical protein [Bacillaceae bacterium]